MFTALLMSLAMANTPDGTTPALESVCDDLSGAGYGLCVAYCEATDCDSDIAKADDDACDALLDRYNKVVGEDPPCASRTHIVEIIYSGDDIVTPYADGVELADPGTHLGWANETSQTLMLESGPHTFAFEINDVAAGAVGFVAAIYVNGALHSVTGDGSFKTTSVNPGSGFEAATFNDSAWGVPTVCTYIPWNSVNLSRVDNAGAQWVWPNGTCSFYASAPDAWFRTTIDLP